MIPLVNNHNNNNYCYNTQDENLLYNLLKYTFIWSKGKKVLGHFCIVFSRSTAFTDRDCLLFCTACAERRNHCCPCTHSARQLHCVCRERHTHTRTPRCWFQLHTQTETATKSQCVLPKLQTPPPQRLDYESTDHDWLTQACQVYKGLGLKVRGGGALGPSLLDCIQYTDTHRACDPPCTHTHTETAASWLNPTYQRALSNMCFSK